MSNDYKSWSEDEERIAGILHPIATRIDISEILHLLGYNRSSSAVRNKLLYRQENTDFPEDVSPATYLEENLEEEEFEAAIQILGADFESDGQEPEDIDRQLLKEIPTTSQKAKGTIVSRELQNNVSLIITDILKKTEEKRALPFLIPLKSGHYSLVIHISDLHLGKLILDTIGKALFNAEISKKQFDILVHQIITIVRKVEKSGDIIDEIILCLNGDLVDSETIYETQPFHIEKHVLDQLRLATNLLWDKLIIELHKCKPDITIRVIACRGNHGRTFGAETSNWDNVVYLLLEILAKATGLPVNVSTSLHEYNTFMVKGHKGLMRHRGPKQDSTPSAMQKYAGWLDLHKFDFMLQAHWHSWSIGGYNGKPIFRNGSLPGSDDLSESMALQNPPMQGAFLINKKDCPYAIYPLYLDVNK